MRSFISFLCLASVLSAADVIHVEMKSGVDGNGALRAAIEKANAQGGRCKVLIPAGDWKLGPADQPEIVTNDVTIEGVGLTTRLHLTGGTYFKWVKQGNWVEGGGLKNIAIYYDRPVTDPAPCVLLSFAAGQQFYDVDYRLGGTFLQCGDEHGGSSRCNLDRCDVMLRNHGWPAVRLRNGTGFYWRHSRTFTDVPAPQWQPGKAMTAWPAMESKEGQDMLLIDGPWDTCRLTSLTSMRFYRGVNVSPPGVANILCVSIDDCVFDYIRENVVYVKLTDKASLNSLIIDGGLHDTWEGDCFSLSGKLVLWPTIRNIRLLFSGKSAVKTGPEKILGLSISNSVLTNTSRMGPEFPALSLGPVERAIIQGNQIGGKDRYPWGDVKNAIVNSGPLLVDPRSNVITEQGKR